MYPIAATVCLSHVPGSALLVDPVWHSHSAVNSTRKVVRGRQVYDLSGSTRHMSENIILLIPERPECHPSRRRAEITEQCPLQTL